VRYSGEPPPQDPTCSVKLTGKLEPFDRLKPQCLSAPFTFCTTTVSPAFDNSTQNVKAGIENRTTRLKLHIDEAEQESFEDFHSKQFGEIYQTAGVTLAVDRLSRKRFLIRYPPGKRRPLASAYDDFSRNRAPIPKRMYRVTPFVKGEQGKSTRGYATSTKSPRIVSSMTPHVNVLMGPSIVAINDKLKELWSTKRGTPCVIACSGMNAGELGDALFEASLLNGKIYEGDFSKFECSRAQFTFDAEHYFIRRTRNNHVTSDGRRLIDHMTKSQNLNGANRSRTIRVSAKGVLVSGRCDTTFGNTIINGLLQLYMYSVANAVNGVPLTVKEMRDAGLRIFINGDDSLVFAPRHYKCDPDILKRLGFTLEMVERDDVTSATFCSQRLYKCVVNGRVTIRPAPQIGRMAGRFGVFVQPPCQPGTSAADTLVVGSSSGLKTLVNHVGPLKAMCDAAVRLHSSRFRLSFFQRHEHRYYFLHSLFRPAGEHAYELGTNVYPNWVWKKLQDVYNGLQTHKIIIGDAAVYAAMAVDGLSIGAHWTYGVYHTNSVFQSTLISDLLAPFWEEYLLGSRWWLRLAVFLYEVCKNTTSATSFVIAVACASAHLWRKGHLNFRIKMHMRFNVFIILINTKNVYCLVLAAALFFDTLKTYKHNNAQKRHFLVVCGLILLFATVAACPIRGGFRGHSVQSISEGDTSKTIIMSNIKSKHNKNADMESVKAKMRNLFNSVIEKQTSMKAAMKSARQNTRTASGRGRRGGKQGGDRRKKSFDTNVDKKTPSGAAKLNPVGYGGAANQSDALSKHKNKAVLVRSTSESETYRYAGDWTGHTLTTSAATGQNVPAIDGTVKLIVLNPKGLGPEMADKSRPWMFYKIDYLKIAPVPIGGVNNTTGEVFMGVGDDPVSTIYDTPITKDTISALRCKSVNQVYGAENPKVMVYKPDPMMTEKKFFVLSRVDSVGPEVTATDKAAFDANTRACYQAVFCAVACGASASTQFADFNMEVEVTFYGRTVPFTSPYDKAKEYSEGMILSRYNEWWANGGNPALSDDMVHPDHVGVMKAEVQKILKSYGIYGVLYPAERVILTRYLKLIKAHNKRFEEMLSDTHALYKKTNTRATVDPEPITLVRTVVMDKSYDPSLATYPKASAVSATGSVSTDGGVGPVTVEGKVALVDQAGRYLTCLTSTQGSSTVSTLGTQSVMFKPSGFGSTFFVATDRFEDDCGKISDPTNQRIVRCSTSGGPGTDSKFASVARVDQNGLAYWNSQTGMASGNVVGGTGNVFNPNTALLINGTTGQVPITVTAGERLSGGARVAETDKSVTMRGASGDGTLYTKTTTVLAPSSAGVSGGPTIVSGFNGASNVAETVNGLTVITDGTRNWIQNQTFDSKSGLDGTRLIAGDDKETFAKQVIQESGGMVKVSQYGSGGSNQLAVNGSGSAAANITAVDSAVDIGARMVGSAIPGNTIPVYLTNPSGSGTVNVTNGCIEMGIRGSNDGTSLTGTFAKVETTGSLDTKNNITGLATVAEATPQVAKPGGVRVVEPLVHVSGDVCDDSTDLVIYCCGKCNKVTLERSHCGAPCAAQEVFHGARGGATAASRSRAAK